MNNNEVITHGGTDRGYKICRCSNCNREEECTPQRDFYTTIDNGPLYCETCFCGMLHTLMFN